MKGILIVSGVLVGVVAVAGSEVYFSSARCGDAQATAPDFIVSTVCQMACATKLHFREADVAAQPGASVGQLTRCPVSGVVFAVGEGSARVSHAGKDYYLCCGGCERKFMQNPTRFTKTRTHSGRSRRRRLHVKAEVRLAVASMALVAGACLGAPVAVAGGIDEPIPIKTVTPGSIIWGGNVGPTGVMWIKRAGRYGIIWQNLVPPPPPASIVWGGGRRAERNGLVWQN